MAELSGQQEQEVGATIKPHRSRNGFWFGIFILLIIASVAGAGFFLFTQLRDRQEGLGGEVKGEMSKQLADYQSQLTAIQNQLAALETEISGKDNHFTQTLADFSQLHNEKLDSTRKELNESIQHLQRQLGKTRGDWLVADAEYLLSVANERLHLIGDVNTTREALEAADQRLRESGDVGVIKVREQIAKDLAVIRSVDMPDIVGLYASIQGLESLAEKLSLLLPYSGKALTPSTEIHSHADKSEQEHDLLQSAIDQLEGIVTIRHSDQPIKAILTPEQAEFIREQLRVKLEIVKIALVERNEAIYQASLNDTKGWIGQHFTQNDESRTLLAELDRLMATKIRGQFPDISQSFKMLRDVTKLRLENDKGMDTEGAPAPVAQPVSPTPPPLAKPVQAPPLKRPVKPSGEHSPEAQ
ncbi:MAG: uroporphyrinogen-III C-methyltransferase [Methylovulum sp.]|uniref:uroporphyrinogen-III C-methyltransferase n=1 Tax=Methylovulum sp. TaxID=1916980 RepID=UPI0026271DD7|nr:uroporphyrinogen-III C-methyltransferase [Methylovulum sp.]MDD2723353.1 uroporphyrinogen-III C-methyltransferase [Methylovulum sp.]MDD5125336.1 uroporphyrinogen-III C-methyltransferase [Methylovulum sp.]